MSSPARTLHESLRRAAASEEAWLVDGVRRLRWAHLLERSRALAAGLDRHGVKPGDRIALWLPNGESWLASFFACAQLGAIAVSINTRFRSAEVGDLVRRSGARLLLLRPHFKDIDFEGILAACPRNALEGLDALVLEGEGKAAPPAQLAGRPAIDYRSLFEGPPLTEDRGRPDSPCVIFTTSGTTKAPKLVLHAQERLLQHAHNVAAQYRLRTRSRMVQIPPFCGVYGFCTALATIVTGATLVLAPTWNPATFAGLIDGEGITHGTASNEAIGQLLEERRGLPRPYPTLQLLVCANLNPALNEVAAQCADRGIVAIGLYGSSEVQALFAHRSAEESPPLRGRPGGFPASRCAKVRARDLETGAICAAGEPGELEIFAPESRFVCYFNDAEATRAAFTADGYFRTGDLGSVEADGTFAFQARLGDTLRLGGFLVSPAEIEDLIQTHPAVHSCQIVAIEHEAAQRPVAFVIPQHAGAIDSQAIIDFTAGRLAKYKVPVRVFEVPEFPTTPSANGSKVQKSRLREMALALMAADLDSAPH